MSKLLAAALALALVVPPCYGEQPRGNEWNRWPSSAKLAFLNGYVSGRIHANVEWRVSVWLTEPKGLTKQQIDKIHKDIIDRTDQMGIRAKNASYAQYISGLDDVFKDYRNQDLPVGDVLLVVDGSIAGDTPDETEARLVALRKRRSEEEE